MEKKYNNNETLYAFTTEKVGTIANCSCGCLSYTKNGNRICPNCGGNFEETTKFNGCDYADNAELSELQDEARDGNCGYTKIEVVS